MFITVFATLSALIGVYSINNNTNYHDFNHLKYVTKSDLDEQGTEAGTINLVGGATARETTSNLYQYVTPTVQNGVITQYNILRYYIISELSVEIGYIDFYCNTIGPTQEDNVTYYIPTVEAHFSERYNIKFSVMWSITNSNFPSTYLNQNFNIDASLEADVNYFANANKSSLISSTYYNKLTYGLTIVGYPMNQEEWNAKSLAYQDGYDKGYSDGYEEGHDVGYNSGYGNGYSEALDQGSTAATIFSGVVTVGLLPVNVFLGILNFEVFGINIGAFVAALMTVAIVIIIIKMFTGGGGKSD